jgi:predicted PurR-regulated permease PerM
MTDQEFGRRVVRTVGTVAIAGLILWSLWVARDALLVIYISVLLAIGFGPVVHSIEHYTTGTGRRRRRFPRWLAILVIYIAIVGSLTVIGLLVIPPLVRQARDLWVALPDLLERAQTFLINRGLLHERITLEQAVRGAPGTPGDAVGTVATAFAVVFEGILGFITILMLTFYLLLESETLFTGFARLFPRPDRPRVEHVARQISTKISAWLSGQLILAGAIGISAAIGLYALGVPYFYVLALVAAIGEVIPVVGPILSAIPAVAVAFAVSPQTGIFVLVFWIAQQQVENHLLVPKVMERQVGVSPVIVIAALLIGGAVLGIPGAILAVPTAAIIQVVVQELLDERDRQSERTHLP